MPPRGLARQSYGDGLEVIVRSWIETHPRTCALAVVVLLMVSGLYGCAGLPIVIQPPSQKCPAGQHWCDERGGGCLPDATPCGPYVKPKPEQPATPACPEVALPWCHEAGLQCGACKHQPPSSECPIAAPACPEPPKPEPKPTFPVLGQPLIDDGLLTAKPGDMSPTRFGVVTAAVLADQVSSPLEWQVDRLAKGPAGIDAAFARISGHLAPIRAAQSITRDGQRSDALFVAREAGVEFEEWHLFGYANGAWANGPGAMKGVYVLAGATCGDPVPPGIGRIKLVVHNVGPNRTRLDATQYVHSQGYCRAVGFTDGRLFCAVRQEGAPDREACEALFPIRWSGPGFADESNPNLWIVPRGTGGTVTACAGTECQSIEVQP
jgi:hypothetical protein